MCLDTCVAWVLFVVAFVVPHRVVSCAIPCRRFVPAESRSRRDPRRHIRRHRRRSMVCTNFRFLRSQAIRRVGARRWNTFVSRLERVRRRRRRRNVTLVLSKFSSGRRIVLAQGTLAEPLKIQREDSIYYLSSLFLLLSLFLTPHIPLPSSRSI